MDYKQIEAFINVVRYKSFSKAADAMFFAQPTISTHVQSIEQELGVKLLNRKGRTVEMTKEGRKLYHYAVEMLNIRDQAIDELNRSEGEGRQILAIESSSIPATTFLPELLSEYRREKPQIRYFVESSDTQTVVDNIIERYGEIGFVGEKYAFNNLRYDHVFSDDMVLIAPASYDLADEMTSEEIVKYPVIWRESGSATRKAFEKALADKGIGRKNIDVAASFNDLYSIIRSVEQGLGVAILSRYTAERIGSPLIKNVTISDFDLAREFYMVTRKDVSLSPLAEDFIEFARSYFARVEKKA